MVHRVTRHVLLMMALASATAASAISQAEFVAAIYGTIIGHADQCGYRIKRWHAKRMVEHIARLARNSSELHRAIAMAQRIKEEVERSPTMSCAGALAARRQSERELGGRIETPRPKATRGQVMEAQRLLNALGYDAGPEDGLLGSRTVSAITAFQRDRGHAVDGEVDQALLNQLRRPAPQPPVDPVKERIRSVQRLLNTLGYDAGEEDGVLGSGTVSAVKAFQRDRGLETDGEVDVALLHRLKAAATGPAARLMVALEAVDARGGPTAEHQVVASLDEGQEVTVVGEIAGGDWYRVELPDGTHAYIASLMLVERPEPGESLRDCPTCPELVLVPAGEFLMGSPDDEEGRHVQEGPEHRVALDRAFAVGRYEVTFAEWDACVEWGGCAYRPDDNGWGRDDRPVTNVSWHEAQEYVAWLSRVTGQRYRLPTEAEWEYAARSGTRTRYWWGDAVGRGKANCDGCGSRWDNERTAPVGSFAANSFGLYDVHGNVREWVEDCWHDGFGGAPSRGGGWVDGSDCNRVSRGGSWMQVPNGVRSASRTWRNPELRASNFGFRVARDP
jgi:formylglycine-generating enzyme required for sulfatase activity